MANLLSERPLLSPLIISLKDGGALVLMDRISEGLTAIIVVGFVDT